MNWVSAYVEKEMIQFNCFRTCTVPKIINKIKGYNYISFDIFDTLLRRKVLHPTDVFTIVGEKNGDFSFKEKRIKAEIEARQHATGEEVTLDDIYKELGKEYETYKQDELEVESNQLSANPFLFEAYRYCQSQGKQIIITSDMYLPKVFLQKILHQNGIVFDHCFVSSEYGVQKVTGRLFRKELEALHISPSQIIHVGDSVRADAIGAWRAGIKFVLIPKASSFSIKR